METIKNYLDNLFASYPKTSEVENAKSELLNNMEDRYSELKSKGKSENEAIGIVISEFGNIDELMKELNVKSNVTVEDTVSVSGEEAKNFIEAKKKNAVMVGTGVFIIIMGLVAMILMGNLVPGLVANRFDISEPSTISNALDAVTLLPLFLCIAIAVAIFIISDGPMQKYKYIEKKNISLSSSTKVFLMNCKDKYQTTYTMMVTLGVVLCVLAPFLLISIICIFGETDLVSSIAVSVLLTMIAIAVFLFIRSGEEMSAYKQLLQEEDYSIEHKKANSKSEIIGSIYWPIVVAIYLFWSFVTYDWHITWIIWPVAGVLFGVVVAILNVITGVVNTNK